MIIESYVPNDRDGLFYNIKKVAGPFTNEIQARRVAKAWSGSENSDDTGSEQLAGCSRRKIIAKKIFEPEFMEPKKKKICKKTEDKVYTNLTAVVQLPEPPALGIHYNIDNPHEVTAHSESGVETNDTLVENVSPTSSAVSTITSFAIDNIIQEDLPDQNDSLIGSLEQSTNNSLFNFLTTTAPSSYNHLEDNFIGGENISVLPFQKDVEKKSTSNGQGLLLHSGHYRLQLAGHTMVFSNLSIYKLHQHKPSRFKKYKS